MRNIPFILGAVLVVQLGLAGVLAWQQNEAGQGKSGPLLSFDQAAVDRVVIDQPDGKSLTLMRDTAKDTKGKTGWHLAVGYPVVAGRVDGLLTSLADLKRPWPVATTADALKRFKVADDDFERRLTLEAGGKTVASLLLGTSPSFRQTDVRLAGQDDVYNIPLETADMTARAGDWADHSSIALDEQKMTQIAVGGLVLEHRQPAGSKDKAAKVWQLADLATGEQMDAGKVDGLVSALASPSFSDVLAAGSANAYDFAAPAAEAKVTMADGKQITYTLGKTKDGQDDGLEISGHPYIFVLPSYASAPLTDVKRDTLVNKPANQQAAPAPARTNKVGG
jgi:hypothetical protein